MKTTEFKIRTASVEDAEVLLAIYAPYVEKTAITFEYEVPTVAEFRSRIKNTLQKYPYIVIEKAGKIYGYAYTGAFKSRAAYDWAVETSIYVDMKYPKQGLGKKLYLAIEDISRRQNIINLNACIGYPQKEDQHLTKNSVEFHAHLGYRKVGTFHKCGYKFGTWYDMVWMEKMLGRHNANPAPIIPYLDL